MTDNPYRYPYVPIGGIVEWDGTGLIGAPDLSTPEKVAAVYGYGTWERYGVDRVTVGAGGKYAVGSTGGEKEVYLTADEIPSLDMPLYMNGNTGYPIGCYPTSGSGRGEMYPANIGAKTTCEQDLVVTRLNHNQKAVNNMQPYIGTYKYRRIK